MTAPSSAAREQRKRDARLVLACLDLTSLNASDTEASTAALCARAQTPHGPVAAVCVWPDFVAQARASLPKAIKVAAVANFPEGDLDLPRALADIEAIVQAGGDEVDVVLPWRRLKDTDGLDVGDIAEFLAAVRHATQPLRLKVILESGELHDEALVRRASQLALGAGADFLKTSTGKTPTSATPEAARWMLDEIRMSSLASAGFKASGGIRTVDQARDYLALARHALGAAAVGPARVRFGASALLDDVLAVLDGHDAATAQPSGY